MDVIEHIDCDSNAESDVSKVCDSLSIVSNDDDLEPSRESDVTTTSTITTSMTHSTGSTSNPTSNGVSLLSVLKAPSASDFSRICHCQKSTSWQEKNTTFKFTEQPKNHQASTKSN